MPDGYTRLGEQNRYRVVGIRAAQYEAGGPKLGRSQRVARQRGHQLRRRHLLQLRHFVPVNEQKE